MKKTFAFLFAVAAMAAVSCNKEVQELTTPESELVPMTFTATTAETKTMLTDQVKVNWLASDKISVFDGVGNQQFTSSGSGTTVQFTGNAAAAATYNALYPYDANASLSGTSVSTSLPDVQTATVGSFADGLNINAAQSSSTTFVFDNVLSVAKITVNSANLGGKTIQSIKLISTNYALAGDVNVTFGATCTAAAGTTTTKEVTLNGGANGLTNGDYYFVVLPNAGGEISLVFTSTDGYTARKTANVSDFLSGTIKNLGSVRGLTWTKKYSIVFGKEMSTNSAQLSSSTRASTVISSGIEYVTTQPFTVVSGSAFYGDSHTSCLRIGASKNAGQVRIALSSSGSVTAKQIIVNCTKYSQTNNDGNLSVNNSTPQAVPSTAGDLVFDFNNTDITSITLATTKSTYIYSIDVVYVYNPSGQGEQGDGNYYKLVTSINDITAGTYVIGALRSTSATDKFYFATTTISSGDWNVEGTGLTVAANNNERKFAVENLPANAKEFTFTGNNTDGFTILNGSNYLYITNTGSSRKLGFASTGSSQRWKCIGKSSGSPLIAGGIYFSAVLNSGSYTISENSTDTNCLRGYNSATQYRAIYLFKKVNE